MNSNFGTKPTINTLGSRVSGNGLLISANGIPTTPYKVFNNGKYWSFDFSTRLVVARVVLMTKDRAQNYESAHDSKGESQDVFSRCIGRFWRGLFLTSGGYTRLYHGHR